MNTLSIEATLAKKYGYKPLPKELSEKYRNYYIENLPAGLKLSGDNVSLYSSCGTLICTGYNRIVVGDYGAFVEFDYKQAALTNFTLFPGQEYRVIDPCYVNNVKYFWLTTKDPSKVKIYFQRGEVSYADYKKDMYYVSPHQCSYIPF